MRARDSQSGDAAPAAPRIWGKYRLSGRVDAGDQRLIYRGVEVAGGRQVTVEILTKPALDDQFDERLSRAVEVFRRPRSEQLVAVFEHGVTQDGTRFVAMAPLVGQSLAARLEARRRLPVAEAVSIACGVAEAIAGLHKRQIVYGALEPSRVFLVPDARGGHRVRLLLGVTPPPGGTSTTLSGRTSDQRSGTYLARGEALYGFLSPEQLTRQPSFASDVFAVGALTYAMIAGAPPFARAQSPSDLAPLEPLSARVKDAAIPSAIDATLARALAFDAESRHRSLEELANDLRAVLVSDVVRSVRPAAETLSSLPEPESLLGATVGRYRVERCLAAGEDALIFRGIDRTSKAPVNITAFVVTSDTERELGERLASADRLRSSNVSGFVDVFESGYLSSGLFYVVSDAWEETLADRLRAQRPMLATAVVALVAEVAAALDAMHACGEVHRELTPSNIVFTEADRSKPKLSVVGAPRRKLGDEASRGGVPQSLAAAARSVRSIFGACAYASPEEASSGWIGVRSNVYSLATIAYEMLTGTALFDGSEMMQLVRHLASPIDPPSRRAPEGSIPAQWDEPILRALSKQASARFVSAADFAEELTYALESAPPPSAQPVRSDPMATEASVVVPLIRTLTQTSAVEPSLVVPLTRLASSRGSSSRPPRALEDSDWDWDSEPDSQPDEAALPLTRQAAIPLVTPRPAPFLEVAESAPPRDALKMALLALAVIALAAGLWFAARYLR